MSVQKLSDIDPKPESEKVQEFLDTPSPAAESKQKLDSYVSGVVDRMYPDDDEKPAPRKSMDTLLSEGLDKHYAERDEQAAWEKSKPALEELGARYAAQGNIAKTLETFLDVADNLKANPRETAQNLARAYLQASRYNLDKTPAKKEKSEAYIVDGKRYSGKLLSDLIDSAYDSATEDKANYAATAKTRERLKALWPDLSTDQAIARIVAVDRRMHEDPLAGAAELGAAFGMGVLPQDIAREEEQHVAQQHVQAASTYLPYMDNPAFKAKMAEVILQYGLQGDEQSVLRQAHQIAVHDLGREQQEHRAIAAYLGEIEKVDPAAARQTADVLLKDKDFAKFVGAGIANPQAKVAAALHWVKTKVQQTTQRAVDKAKRAAPVKSSSGAIPGGTQPKGIDQHVANALKDWR